MDVFTLMSRLGGNRGLGILVVLKELVNGVDLGKGNPLHLQADWFGMSSVEVDPLPVSSIGVWHWSEDLGWSFLVEVRIKDNS